MALVMTPIYTQTVGAGGANTVTFNNIPQFYTDLQIKMSLRTDEVANETQIFILLNGSSSNFSQTRLYGTGSATGSERSSFSRIGSADSASNTSNTFSSNELYIPNYTSSNYKQIITDNVLENNATFAIQAMHSVLWSNTAAITSLSIQAFGTVKFVQYSTISLYGIIRFGA